MSTPVPAPPVMFAVMNNSELLRGDIIVERSERGNITNLFIIVSDPEPCTATLGNVHVAVRGTRTDKGMHNFCYAGSARSEVRA